MLIAIVIPTYNENDNIKILIPILQKILIKNNINGITIVIDDNSTDGTQETLNQFVKNLNEIIVINRNLKLGIGSAYKEGFSKVLSLGCNGIIEMDADLSHDPEMVPIFVKLLEDGYDLVIGSRYIKGGSIIEWNFSRRIISEFSNKLAIKLLGLKVKDATSGFKAFSLKAIKNMNISSIKSNGYAFQIETVFLCESAGLRIKEIPIKFKNRKKGKSKLKFKEKLYFLLSILRLTLIKIKKSFF